jgi:hypothetical protein
MGFLGKGLTDPEAVIIAVQGEEGFEVPVLAGQELRRALAPIGYLPFLKQPRPKPL